jgi:TRAP-type C4-dicarboxylate transport system permease small subunit
VRDKFEKFNHRLSGWFEWIGVAGLLAMMLVTVIDVIGAKLFLSPLLGAMDWVRVWQSVAIAFACAATLIVGRHVRVDFIVARLPQRAQAVINSLINFLCLCLFVLLIWRTSVLGYTLQVTGEVSATAHIPRFIFAYGIALASIPVCLLFLQELISSVMKVVKR